MTTLDDLADTWADDEVPPVDRPDAEHTQLDPLAQHWRTHGWAAIPGLLDDTVLDDYANEWIKAHATRIGTMDGKVLIEPHAPGGWNYCTPHRDNPALARLVCDSRIADILQLLLAEPAGVHLTLTGWRTTTRDWHPDCYLNPPGVGGFYVAVWIALDDIHPDSGPFQYIDGSHRWPPLSQARVREALGRAGRGPDWPTRSEELLTPLYEAKIADEQLEVVDYLPKRGDVLFWHSRLLHRGSRPRTPGRERRALIAHYSGLNHRTDMPAAEPVHGGWMFPVDDHNGLPAQQMRGGT